MERQCRWGTFSITPKQGEKWKVSKAGPYCYSVIVHGLLGHVWLSLRQFEKQGDKVLLYRVDA